MLNLFDKKITLTMKIPKKHEATAAVKMLAAVSKTLFSNTNLPLKNAEIEIATTDARQPTIITCIYRTNKSSIQENILNRSMLKF